MSLTTPADGRGEWNCSICRDLISLSQGKNVKKVIFEEIQRSFTATACPYCKLWTQAIGSYPEIVAAAGEVSIEPNLNQPLQIQIRRRQHPEEDPEAEIKWWNLEIYSHNVKKPRSTELDPKIPFYIGHSFGHVLACDTFSGGECLEQARAWLEECLAGHPNYDYPSDGRKCIPRPWGPDLPTRVLCVEAGREPYLVQFGSRKVSPYVALSYCWGSGNKVQTTFATIEQHKQGIPLQDLPKTLRDAVIVTRYLGFKYLWIDALCIIQDSIEDWEQHSVDMGWIYKDATFVIAASDSPESTSGLFHERKPSYKLQSTIPGDDGESTFFVRPRRERFYPEKQTSRTHVERLTRSSLWNESPFDGSTNWFDALGKRGWVYQEHHMPFAILHFARGELGWSCGSLETCECTFPATSKRHSEVVGVSERLRVNVFSELWQSAYQGQYPGRWRSLVEDYTKLNLTKATDRLPALRGLTTFILESSSDSYFFGLWFHGIQTGDHLCWHVSEATQSRSLPVDYAPTWSWASLYAPVKFETFLDCEAHRFTFGFEDITNQPSTDSAFGPGTGSLQLRGTLVPINVHDESGFYTDRGVDYGIVEELARLFAAGQISDPNPAEYKLSVPGIPDVFGKSIDDLPDVLNGDIIPDVFPLLEDDGAFHFFIIVETVEMSMDGQFLTRPHGLILHREGTGKNEKFRRVGWADSCANMPTEWWKTCGWTQSVVIV